MQVWVVGWGVGPSLVSNHYSKWLFKGLGFYQGTLKPIVGAPRGAQGMGVVGCPPLQPTPPLQPIPIPPPLPPTPPKVDNLRPRGPMAHLG